MPETTTDQLKLINARRPLARLLIFVPVVLALAGAWTAARWYVGNTMAEYAPKATENGLETAREAAQLAPDDPVAHWAIASLEKNDFSPEAAREAVRRYEEAAQLSPADYRLWIDLGQARGQTGDAAGAEKAFRRAVELAPAYAYPRWYLGNQLLRQNKTNEAFSELQRAAEAYPTLRAPVFDLAAHVYGNDLTALKNSVARSPATQAALALYLAEHNRMDEALRIWNELSASQKKEEQAAGKTLLKTLAGARRYHAAISIYRDVKGVNDKDSVGVPTIGQFTNGGFEQDGGLIDAPIFDWQIRSTPPQASVAFDVLNRHGGARSLRIVFNAPGQLTFNNIEQLIAVDSGAAYRLEFYVRTKELKTAGQPIIEIHDASAGEQVIGSSRPLSAGTNDWQNVAIDFKTSLKTEGVAIRTSRASCGTEGGALCPIFGTVWYDDFSLQRIGGESAARRSGATNPAQK